MTPFGGAHRLARLIVKEFIQLRRDPVTLRLALVAPILQLVLLGYAATRDVKHIPTVVCDLDRSAASRALTRAVLESGYFEPVGRAERLDEVPRWLDGGRAVVALVFPTNYGERLDAGGRAPLQALIDGSNSSEATTTMGYLSGIVLNESITAALRRLPPGALGGRRGAPLDAEMRVRYNESLVSSHFMIPGVLGLVMMVSTLLLTSIAVTREKEVGTIEQILVTPIRPHEFLLGKTIPFSLLGMVNVAVVLAVARFWFQVPIRGSLLLLFFLAAIFLLTTLGTGLFAAATSDTQQSAMLTCMAFVTPNMLLSGFIFPIENMPAPIQWLTYLMPMRYFLRMVRGIMLKSVGLEVLWPDALALAGFGVGIFLASLLAFRNKAA
jgi:ABC-2 type transport system permease protein